MNNLAEVDAHRLKLLINIFNGVAAGQDAGPVRAPRHLLAVIRDELLRREIAAVFVKVA
jgi:hypothetical protein